MFVFSGSGRLDSATPHLGKTKKSVSHRLELTLLTSSFYMLEMMLHLLKNKPKNEQTLIGIFLILSNQFS